MEEDKLLVTIERIHHIVSDPSWSYYEYIRQAVVTGICQLGPTDNFKDYTERVAAIVNSTEVVSADGGRVRLQALAIEMWSAYQLELDNFTFDLDWPGHVSLKSVFCMSTESRRSIFIHVYFHVVAENISIK
jgi:hypothetical protein